MKSKMIRVEITPYGVGVLLTARRDRGVLTEQERLDSIQECLDALQDMPDVDAGQFVKRVCRSLEINGFDVIQTGNRRKKATNKGV